MRKVLFICHGNICRSPMAEMIMKHLVRERGLEGQFSIASAATSTEEIGNPIYPPARRELAAHGVPVEKRAARQVTMRDYMYYDLLIGMDNANIRNMRRMLGGDPQGLCGLSPSDRHGQRQHPQYAPDAGRRPGGEDPSADGLHRSAGRGVRPVVFGSV